MSVWQAILLGLAGIVLVVALVGALGPRPASTATAPRCQEVVTLHRDANRTVYEYRPTRCEAWR